MTASSRRSRVSLILGALAILIAATLLARGWLPSPPPAAAGARGTAGEDGGASAASEPALPVAARQPVAGEPVVGTASPQPPPLTFEQYVEHTVRLALEAQRAFEEEEQALLSALDAEARALWDRLWREVRAPEEAALLHAGELLAEDVTVRAQVRRRVCSRVLAEGLRRRHRDAERKGDRDALDALVSSVLAALPRDETLTGLLAPLLTDRPYLGLAHEEDVLALVSDSAEWPFLREAAVELLLTLWRNLEARDARTSRELTALALVFKDDANPSRRLAALRHLLVARGGELRELVLADVERSRDREVARALAAAAAAELEPAAALEVLTRMSDVAATDLSGALMMVADRDAASVREAYDRQLAGGARPVLRAELVSALGFHGGSDGIETARWAFDHDPAPAVRQRAMFALTAQAGSALGERVLMAALDDPALGGGAAGLGAIALALENLEGGDPNTVDRVAQRLLARPELDPTSRRRVEELLARVLPGR